MRLATLQIRPAHLDRWALISLRQSPLLQVRDHTGSTARPSDLVSRARALGWPQERLPILEQAQGQSGASAAAREGCQWLGAAVGLPHAGAVCGLEASRLARSWSAWDRLVALCALPETLGVAEDGVYAPGQSKDRWLLGFQGPRSAAARHWLRQPLLGGQLANAAVGQLRFRLPVGLVYDPTGRGGLAPDAEGVAAGRRGFALVAQYGSALAVVTHLGPHPLRFPTRLWGGGHAGARVWGRLPHGRGLSRLHHPCYAGASVYGRTVTRPQVLPGEAPRLKGRTRQMTREEWPIVGLDAHPGSLAWEQFQRNHHQREDHRPWRPEERRGAVRDGAARLQGRVLCGRCGRRMSVRSLRDGRTPIDEGHHAHPPSAARTCHTMRGDHMDAAVTRSFLAALPPAHLDVARAAWDQIAARAQPRDRQWPLRTDRAPYAADLARRRYGATAPAHRVVARALEREWNETLPTGETREREDAVWHSHALRAVPPEERQRLLARVQDVPAGWHAPTTTPQGVVRVREVAPAHTDQQSAARLNADGVPAGLGGPFTPRKVGWRRWAYALQTGGPERPKAGASGQRGDGRYAAPQAAELLHVQVSTLSAWCQQGRLERMRAAPMRPRWMTLTPESSAALRRPVQRRHRRRQTRA